MWFSMEMLMSRGQKHIRYIIFLMDMICIYVSWIILGTEFFFILMFKGVLYKTYRWIPGEIWCWERKGDPMSWSSNRKTSIWGNDIFYIQNQCLVHIELISCPQGPGYATSAVAGGQICYCICVCSFVFPLDRDWNSNCAQRTELGCCLMSLEFFVKIASPY